MRAGVFPFFLFSFVSVLLAFARDRRCGAFLDTVAEMLGLSARSIGWHY